MSFVITYSEPVYQSWLVTTLCEDIKEFLRKRRVEKREFALLKGIQEYIDKLFVKIDLFVGQDVEIFKKYGYLNE